MTYLSTLNGDGPCGTCGTTENIVWFTDDVFWNNVVQVDRSPWGGLDPILCLPCFVRLAEERGMRPTGWRVMAEWPWRTDEGLQRDLARSLSDRFAAGLAADGMIPEPDRTPGPSVP